MSNIIKCPICHEMAGLRYNENRVYQSRCQNMECRETVTVTAPSWKVAEELFSKFEKGAELPKLSIPKKIADELEEELKNSEDKLYTFNKCYEDMTLPYKLLLHKNYDIICAYLNPLTRPFVEVEDE